jgi:molybdate transport system substrate-binding protein
MMMKRTTLYSFTIKVALISSLLLIFLSGCNSTSNKPKDVVVVYAGASLTEPFQAIEKAFEAQNAAIDIQINFATGQQQLQQMENGAVVDVFAAAKEQQMLDAIASGFVPVSSQQTFAKNRIIVITPSHNPGNIQSLNDLANSGIKLIVGTDQTAVGQYTNVFLDKINGTNGFAEDYKESVLHNVISYETDVKAVLTKIILGEGDVGIVFVSDYVLNKNKLLSVDIPEAFNELINYTIAITNNGNSNTDANLFLDFVLSSDGQEIIKEYGFLGK